MIELTGYNKQIKFYIPAREYRNAEGAEVELTTKGNWLVKCEGSVKTYTVSYDKGRFNCDCPYNQHKHKLCKHIASVMRTSTKAQIHIIREDKECQ